MLTMKYIIPSTSYVSCTSQPPGSCNIYAIALVLVTHASDPVRLLFGPGWGEDGEEV